MVQDLSHQQYESIFQVSVPQKPTCTWHNDWKASVMFPPFRGENTTNPKTSYTTWKGSMAQLPLVLVYHGPLRKAPPNLGVASDRDRHRSFHHSTCTSTSPGSKICKRSIFFCSMAWFLSWDLDHWSTGQWVSELGVHHLSCASKIYIIWYI